MNLKTLILAPLALLGACQTTAVAAGAETAIPYVNSNGIVEWKVVADDALYIRGIGGDWYLVRTAVRCPRLRTADTLGFVTQLDQLDRYGAILAQGQRCPLASVVRSGPPPEDADG